MKVYNNNNPSNPLVGEVPDDAVCMELGYQADNDILITSINYTNKTYDYIVGSNKTPLDSHENAVFPDKWYRIADIVWEKNTRS